MSTHYGKYRALVTENKDPERQGRIKVQVPYLSGNSVIGWCLPCVPVAYAKGGDLNIPKVGSFVWVEFEHGDIRYPIYTGSLYGAGNIPLDDVDSRLISWGNCSIQMSENSLVLSCGGNTLKLTSSGIEITGSITATNVTATNKISANTASISQVDSTTVKSAEVEATTLTADTITASGNISAGGTVSGSNI